MSDPKGLELCSEKEAKVRFLPLNVEFYSGENVHTDKTQLAGAKGRRLLVVLPGRIPLSTLSGGSFRCRTGTALWFTLWKNWSAKSATIATIPTAGSLNCWAVCIESVPSVSRSWSP